MAIGLPPDQTAPDQTVLAVGTHDPQRRVPEADRLRDGERIPPDEFRRRCGVLEAVGVDFRVEYVNGVVRMMPPPNFAGHTHPIRVMQGLLSAYTRQTPGVIDYTESGVTLPVEETSADVSPDLCLVVQPGRGGQMSVDDAGYFVGPPELVVEVANSSLSYDLGEKRDLYEAAGVQEYLVHATRERRLLMMRRDGDRFRTVMPDADGVLASRIFPGLVFDTAAIIADDIAAAEATLDRVMQSPEVAAAHQNLVASLAEAAK